MACDLELHRTALPAQFFLDLPELIDLAGEEAAISSVAAARNPIKPCAPSPSDLALNRAPGREQDTFESSECAANFMAAIIGGGPWLRIDRGSQSIAIWSAVQHDAIGDSSDEARRRMRAP
jgi:hypothetical protein